MDENINQNNQVPQIQDNAPAPEASQEYHSTPRYGKKPLWQWIVIYVVLGAVAYGLIYYALNYFDQPNPKGNQVGQNTMAISIENSAFAPATLTIRKGTTVIWKNNDTIIHTITADSNGPISPELKKGDSYSVPFPSVGTFSYHCSLHPNMKGTITIVE